MSKIEFVVKYKLNPDYDGEFQVKNLTDQDNPNTEVVGIHGTFRNLGLALTAKGKCKDWFNKETVPVEKINQQNKVVTESRTTLHDNVIVWIERTVDGFLDTEWVECDEKPNAKKKKELATA
jgi:hypothetical protein